MPTIKEILLGIDGDSSGADRAIDRVAAGLEGLDAMDVEATVKLAKAEFEAQLAEVNAQLEALDHKDVSPKVHLQRDKLRSEVEAAAREATTAFERFFQPTFSHGRQTGIIGNIANIARDLTPAARALDDVGKAAGAMEDEVAKASTTMWDLAGRTRDISELARVFIGVLLAGLSPALGALAGTLVAAVGGAGALATAFAASLIPAALGAIAVFTRFSAILNVAKELQTANRDAAYQHAAAEQRATAATEARHAAAVALRDATQGLSRAEREYAQAVADAEKRLSDLRARATKEEERYADTRRRAQRSESDAHRRVVAAQKSLKQAVKDGYQYWLDLIDKVKHDQLDLEGAQLSVLDAQDALNKAQDDYNALLNQIPSDKLGDILQKLNDVNLPEDQVKSFITTAMGADADPRFADKLYTSHLKLLHAQHDLKVATQDVADATKALNSDQKELNHLTNKGIEAYGPYIQATKDLKDAKREENRTLADNKRALHASRVELAAARKELRDYERVGIKGQNSVRNAADSVRDAQERLAEAHRQVRTAAKGASAALDHMGSAASRLKTDLANLSPAEREVLYALVGRNGKGGLKAAFRAAFGTDTVMHAFAGFLRGVGRVLRIIAPDLKVLSGAFAGLLKGLGKAIDSKAAISFFRYFVQAATVMTGLGGGIFKDFIGALANIAKLATPGLIRVFNDLAGSMRRFRENTTKPGAQSAVDTMIDSFRAMMGFIGKLIGGFGRLAIALAPFGNEILKWLGDGAEKLGKWASSAEGTKKIKSFFEDTLPLAKSLVGFVWNLIKAFLQFWQFVAPILKPMVDLLSDIVKWIGKFFGFLNKIIPKPIRDLVGLFGTLFIGVPKVLGFLGKIPGIFGDIAKFLGKLGIVDWIVGAVQDAAGAVVDAGKAVGTAIWGAIKTAFNAGIDVGKWVLDGLGDAAAFGAKIIGWIGNAIKDAAKAATGLGATLLSWIGDGLGAIAGWGTDILKAIAGAIKGAVKTVAGGGAAIANWIVDGLKSGLDVGAKILGWIASGIRDAAKGAAHGLAVIATWLWNGIKSLGSIGERILKWIVNGIRSAGKGLWKLVSSVGKAIANGIWAGLKAFGNWGEKLIGFIWGGIIKVGGLLLKLGKAIGNGIWSGLTWLWTKIKNAIQDAINYASDFTHGRSVPPDNGSPPPGAGGGTGGGRGGGTTPSLADPSTSASTGRDIGAFVAGGIRAAIRDHRGEIRLSISSAFLDHDWKSVGNTIGMEIVRGFAAAGPWLTGIVHNAIVAGTAGVAAGTGPRLAAAAGLSIPTVSGPSRAAVSAPKVASAAASAVKDVKIEDHLHVHGHTQKVDPDPRTTLALQEQRRRKRGTRQT